MGFKLGRFLQKQVKSVVKRAPGIVTGFATAGLAGAGLAAIAPSRRLNGGAVSSLPSFMPGEVTVAGFPGSTRLTPEVQTEGVPFPVAGAMPAVSAGISRVVVSAVLKLASAMGILVTATNFRRVSMRLWRAVTGLARRHPGISVLAFLTGLGLLADEAAEFLFWGQQMQRRRRGRGISARDIRICRRTMRRMASFQRDMFRARPRSRTRGTSGPIIAQN